MIWRARSIPPNLKVIFAPWRDKESLKMILRKYSPILFLMIALGSSAFALSPQDQQSPKQDMKDAGHATKEAAKDTGKATKKTAKKTGHAVKKTTKKAANKSATKTKEGAQKVEDKTQPN
jgi:hypothetical protein